MDWEAEDDVKWRPFDPHEVKTARQRDVQYVLDREVCEDATEAEARARTGRNPVGLKWIDTNKGGAEVPRHRSRLVCTEVRHKRSRTDLLSNTALGSSTSFDSVLRVRKTFFRVEDPFLISIADVSRAHVYADAVRDVHVRLANEAPRAKEPGVCGKPRKTVYESLDAAQRWGELYGQVLEAEGFSRGADYPCHFFHEGFADLHLAWCTVTILS